MQDAVSKQYTVLYLLNAMSEKLNQDNKISEKKAEICQSCIHSMLYILNPLPHRRISPDFDAQGTYSDYLRHLSKSIRRNKSITPANYQNLNNLLQTLQSELWTTK